MKAKRVLGITMMIVLSFSMLTGCGKQKGSTENLEVNLDSQGDTTTESSVEASENETQIETDQTVTEEDVANENSTEISSEASSESSVESKITDSASTTKVDDEQNEKKKEAEEKEAEAESKGKKISVQSLVNDAKKYIKQKKVLESETKCDVLETRTFNGEKTFNHRWGIIKCGFNDEFYYIEEEFQDGMSEDYTANLGGASTTKYSFFVNEEEGYINSMTGKYKILTSIVLDSTDEISDFKPSTMAEFLLDTLVTDMEYCTIGKTEGGDYIITQRLTYGQLAINNSNSWGFSGINENESIREILYFDHDTHRLTGYDVVCTVADVGQNSEIKAQYKATYTYEKTVEFPDVNDKEYVEIDGFHGYSIY